MLRTTLAAQGPAAADRKSLRFVGFLLAAVTAAVVLAASAVVHAHVDGRLTLDDASYAAVPSSTRLVR